MKQPQASVSINDQAAASGEKIGLGILAVIVLLVAAWLQFQSSAPHQSNATALASDSNADLSRFRADAWYLPADALLGFVEIPAGQFLMGSDPAVDATAFQNERWSADRNQGTVALATFYIGRYEVTVAQFSAFVAATDYKMDELALGGIADHPVTNVSWTDALAYSRWLGAQLTQSPQSPAPLRQLLADGWQITIPSEAQWEKAARGLDGRIYPWGNDASREYANFLSTNTVAVGSYDCASCAHGLADMSGNVWELTRSAYQPYPFDAKRMPNLQSDALFVMRGGAFNENDVTVRAAVRGGIDPGARRPFIGFRVALIPK